MVIISIVNQKGGVGKTTTALELCNNLKGKVLAIDMDPQGSLTKASGAEFTDEVYSLKDVLLDGVVIEKAIQHTGNFDVVASNRKLADSSKIFTEIDDVYLLDDVLHKYMKTEYDYIIIDSAPGRSPLLNMAYVASDYLIIPLDADIDSLSGIDEVMNDITKLKRRKLTHVKVLGSFIVAYEKTAMHEFVRDTMAEKMTSYGLEAFNTNIGKTVRIKEAKMFKMSLSQFSKENKSKIKAAKDYANLTKEIVKRIKEDEIEAGEEN